MSGRLNEGPVLHKRILWCIWQNDQQVSYIESEILIWFQLNKNLRKNCIYQHYSKYIIFCKCYILLQGLSMKHSYIMTSPYWYRNTVGYRTNRGGHTQVVKIIDIELIHFQEKCIKCIRYTLTRSIWRRCLFSRSLIYMLSESTLI